MGTLCTHRPIAHPESLPLHFHPTTTYHSAREYLQLQQELEERRKLAVAERLQRERATSTPARKGRPVPAALQLGAQEGSSAASQSRSMLPSPGCHLLYPGTGLTPVLTSPAPDRPF